MNPASNPLDTEIRRAMGELADAAPQARPPESFGPDFEPLTTSSTGPSSNPRGRLLTAAAAVIVAVVGVALVVATSDDSTTISDVPTTLDPELDPDPDVDVAPLTGDALLDELVDRRWVALERFDDPSPTARTPEFTVTDATGGARVDGFDGCNTYQGPFDGNEFTSTTIGCDVDTLGFSRSIEMLPGASTLLLLDADGSPLARFHDIDTLTPASADDMPYTFFGDDLQSVFFGVSGVGVVSRCTRVSWEGSTDGVTVSLLEVLDDCSADVGPLATWLADVTAGGADALLAPDGVVLADEASALYLRRLPVVEVDPDGITLAAGAAFGFQPGLGTSADDVLAALVPRFGEPDLDSGWLPAERNVDDDGNVTVYSPCRELTEYRELWWGDLSFGFWETGSRSFLHYWKVGDERITAFLVPDVEVGPTTPSGVTTEDGVGVGDPESSIPDRFNISDAEQYFGFDPTGEPSIVSVLSTNPAFTPGSVASPTLGGLYVVLDGEVIGFGAEAFGC